MASPADSSLDVAAVSGQVAAVFERIHRERMAGLPILHPDLRVAVVGARAWQRDWLGVLVAPWCMNLVLVPGPGSAHAPGPFGSKLQLDLPAGRFEFLSSEEDGLGRFAACSLVSPMHEFADQAGAVAMAEEIVTALFEPEAPAAPAAPAQDRGVSRRDLLRGAFRR
jgi:[NiFe] hydrogenase assembly HybE family chaperone